MSQATDTFFGELRKYLKCGVCQRKVESVERVFDLIHCTETAVVRCHGQTEVVTLPSELVEDLAGSGRLSLVPAFVRPALPLQNQPASECT